MSLSDNIIRKEELEAAGSLRDFVIERLSEQEVSAAARLPHQFSRHRDAQRDQLQQQRELLRREGYEQGKAEARKQLDTALQALAQALEECRALRAHLYKQAEHDLLALSLAIASRVIAREVALDPRTVAGVARQALELLADKKGLKVRVNPADAQALAGGDDPAAGLTAAGERVEIVPDDSIGRGGCIVEAPSCSVDAELGTQLDELAKHLGVDEHA